MRVCQRGVGPWLVGSLRNSLIGRYWKTRLTLRVTSQRFDNWREIVDVKFDSGSVVGENYEMPFFQVVDCRSWRGEMRIRGSEYEIVICGEYDR